MIYSDAFLTGFAEFILSFPVQACDLGKPRMCNDESIGLVLRKSWIPNAQNVFFLIVKFYKIDTI